MFGQRMGETERGAGELLISQVLPEFSTLSVAYRVT